MRDFYVSDCCVRYFLEKTVKDRYWSCIDLFRSTTLPDSPAGAEGHRMTDPFPAKIHGSFSRFNTFLPAAVEHFLSIATDFLGNVLKRLGLIPAMIFHGSTGYPAGIRDKVWNVEDTPLM
jgi:hypothetical protein